MSILYRKSYLHFLVFMVIFLIVLAGCSTQNTGNGQPLPDFVMDTPTRVKEAYQYAIAHPDDLAAVPCYCGCGNMGHTSNLSCYIRETSPDGTITFDDHAIGCGLCVDIAQDVKRLRLEGQTLSETRAYIDATYSGFGPGTNTPLPEE
jgi:hypothetical protein